MLCHFLHDEGITDHEPHNLRLVETHLLAQNCAVVKLKKQHEPCLAHFTIDNRFQFRERTWRLGRFRELGQIQPPNASFQRGDDGLERLWSCHAESLYFDPSYWHLTLLQKESSSLNPGRRSYQNIVLALLEVAGT